MSGSHTTRKAPVFGRLVRTVSGRREFDTVDNPSDEVSWEDKVRAMNYELSMECSHHPLPFDEEFDSAERMLDADVERIISQGHLRTVSESDDEMINLELQLESGPTRITVTRDEKVYDAVADRLQCKLHQLKQIEFGGVPLSRTEHLTFEEIGIDDGGRLGVDYSVVVSSFVDYCLVLLTVDSLQTGASCTHRRRRSRR